MVCQSDVETKINNTHYSDLKKKKKLLYIYVSMRKHPESRRCDSSPCLNKDNQVQRSNSVFKRCLIKLKSFFVLLFEKRLRYQGTVFYYSSRQLMLTLMCIIQYASSTFYLSTFLVADNPFPPISLPTYMCVYACAHAHTYTHKTMTNILSVYSGLWTSCGRVARIT